MTDLKEINDQLDVIKKILVIQLVQSGLSIRNIVKITGIDTKALYKFLPKNMGEK